MEKLKVKPFLTYSIPKRKEMVSWREWGGVQTKEDLSEEIDRINRELSKLSYKMEFPHEILPLAPIQAKNEIKDEEILSSDVLLIYAAGGSLDILEKLTSFGRPAIFFLRYKSGPVYLWYEIIHARFLRRHTDEIFRQNVSTEDIAVDDYSEVLWRLRAIYGLKSSIGHRIVAVGGPAGWETPYAPHLAREKWGLDIIDYPYSKLGERIRKEKSNKNTFDEIEKRAEEYLNQPNTTLKTDKNFVINSFILYKVFKDLLNEFHSRAITINECMGTILSTAKTTACLPLSMLNDEGYLAFCESDFVAIPAGILLHYISGKPVFLNDPTTPYNGTVVLAHCTSPRKMDGRNYEPVQIVTHFESDYGAAPKVEFKKGEEITVMDPDFNEKEWIVFKGRIIDVPFLDICRSQMEIEIEGDWRKLLREMKGFHWIVCYGDYLREVGYALEKAGIKCITL